MTPFRFNAESERGLIFELDDRRTSMVMRLTMSIGMRGVDTRHIRGAIHQIDRGFLQKLHHALFTA